MNYESPYTIWWDKHIQGKYGVGFEIRQLMAMAFEGGRESRDAEIESLKNARCVACGLNPNLIGGKK